MYTWVLASGLVIAAPALKDKPGGQDFRGDWVSEDALGAADGRPLGPRCRCRFGAGGTYLLSGPGFERNGPRRFRFDSKADPPTVDLDAPAAGESRPATLGIYKVEGDRLTICFAFPGKPRPTEFADKPAGAGYVEHFRRVKSTD